MIKSYTFLICAILAEALGTTTLKLSEQFTKPVLQYDVLIQDWHLLSLSFCLFPFL
jgi:multidrug transporter EmrE-like cation transporter